MITTVRPSARRRRNRRAARIGVSLAGALAVLAAVPAAQSVAHDPLVCFVDAQGRKVRIGETVRDRFGREIGWISGSQCAEDTPPGKLRIVPNLYGPVDPIEVDAGVLLSADKDVVLALSADELDRSLQYARADSREAPS
ncbi:MAG: hypothetical protein JHD15_03325 [Phenylobacterium sp.]|uniref:hypothetical protein n=1 Tax=Phenylobacterium sp. TaxID=1871053 RepID=UPI001A1CFBC2|nr:hypothetical protein [Phenylobacterium sp.]MBJ7409382.1 hypothetical protein [Phenylobacterium sp.]